MEPVAAVYEIWHLIVVGSAVGEYELSKSTYCFCGVPIIHSLTLGSHIVGHSVSFHSQTKRVRNVVEFSGHSEDRKGNVKAAIFLFFLNAIHAACFHSLFQGVFNAS